MSDLTISKPQELSELFNRFVESSTQLQTAYDELRKETDSLRQRLNKKDQEIAQAAKMATLGQAAAALAHEIRNPLGAIKLFSSLLKDELDPNKQGLKYLEHIEISISQLDATISNILQFSKQENPALSPVNLAALIKERVAAFHISNSKVDFRINIDSENILIAANEQSIRQVLNNLLTNACQATKNAGMIELTVRQSDSVIITIKDNGPGIKAEVLSDLFEPFVTTKNEGVGLGLSIVKRLIEQHKGTIEAANDNGAIFTITFPSLTASNKRLAA